MLYFVVRTDAVNGDGKQRVFGCYDTEQEANDFIVQLSDHMKGDFKVFGGKPIES